jgi:hypothetical protein
MIMCKKRVGSDNGRELTLIYSVTVDELTNTSLNASVESYGVGVTVEESGEEVYVRHITLHSSEIFRITSCLSSNFVTPTTLTDIVEDWLCR